MDPKDKTKKNYSKRLCTYQCPRRDGGCSFGGCEIQRGTINLDNTGITFDELMKHNPGKYRDGQICFTIY
jgi:hypothetical protein